MENLRDVLQRPIITEHTADLMVDKKYTFEVNPKANKSQIKAAVEEAFGVKVAKVNTMNVKGKFKRMGQHAGYRSDTKKAIVQLTEDSKDLDFFEA